MVAEAQEKAGEQAVEVKVSDSMQKIITAIENLSVLELADLVKALEKKFGVSAQAPMSMMAMPMAGAAGGGAAAPKEEKTEFDVVLTAAGDKKIQVIKVVRELTGLGLKESKELVDGAPKPVKTGIPQAEADTIKAKLTEVGATVEIK
jgi:large subunit ribosomal protein L7/L12